MAITEAPNVGSSGGTGLLGVVDRTANGSNYTTTSATLVDVDATNAAVTFTAPSSGNVLVRMTAAAGVSAVQNGFFGIRESTTAVGAKRLVTQGGGGGVKECTTAWLITGIAAGSHTYKAAFAVNGGATFTLYQEGAATGNGGIALEVWEAP